MNVSGIATIKDTLSGGYPFIESILSVLPIVDEFLINDGGSTDGTEEVLQRLRNTFPKKIKLSNTPWFKSVMWETIDRTLEELMRTATGDWLFEIQCDELWHEQYLMALRQQIEQAHANGYNAIRQPRLDATFSFVGGYKYQFVRVVRNLPNLTSHWGGDDFQIGEHKDARPGFTSSYVPSEMDIGIPCFHFHRVFYQNNPIADARIAEDVARDHGERIAEHERMKNIPWQAMLSPKKEELDPALPAIIRDLATETRYRVRDELFDMAWLSRTTGLAYG